MASAATFYDNNGEVRLQGQLDGGVPPQWTVEPGGALLLQPGPESVTAFAPALQINAPVGAAAAALDVLNIVDENGANIAEIDATGTFSYVITTDNAKIAFADHGGPNRLRIDNAKSFLAPPTGGQVSLRSTNSVDLVLATDDAKISFYGKAAVAQQTGVAVTAAAIHAALVNLGLIIA